MIDNNYYVYVYCDPRNNNRPFYVGKGSGNRINNHLTETLEKTSNKRKFYKIESIRNDGLKPYIFKYAENLPEEQAYDFEDFLISAWGRKDFDENGILFNILEPGQRSASLSGPDHPAWGKPGAMLGKHLTKEQIEKVSKSKQGKKRESFSEEWRKRMSVSASGENNSMYGKNHTLKTKSILRLQKLGTKQTQQTINKKIEGRIKAAQRGYEKMIPEITKIQESGITTYKGIARELNNRGLKTARNCDFDDGMAKRILIYIKTRY